MSRTTKTRREVRTCGPSPPSSRQATDSWGGGSGDLEAGVKEIRGTAVFGRFHTRRPRVCSGRDKVHVRRKTRTGSAIHGARVQVRPPSGTGQRVPRLVGHPDTRIGTKDDLVESVSSEVQTQTGQWGGSSTERTGISTHNFSRRQEGSVTIGPLRNEDRERRHGVWTSSVRRRPRRTKPPTPPFQGQPRL